MYSLFGANDSIVAVVLFITGLFGVALFGRITSRISTSSIAARIAISGIAVGLLASVSLSSAFLLVSAGAVVGSGNPREEIFLEEGHIYYIFDRYEQQIAGPEIIVGIYDKTKSEYHFWKFSKLTPTVFRVVVKNNGERVYEELVRHKSSPQLPGSEGNSPRIERSTNTFI